MLFLTASKWLQEEGYLKSTDLVLLPLLILVKSVLTT